MPRFCPYGANIYMFAGLCVYWVYIAEEHGRISVSTTMPNDCKDKQFPLYTIHHDDRLRVSRGVLNRWMRAGLGYNIVSSRLELNEEKYK